MFRKSLLLLSAAVVLLLTAHAQTSPTHLVGKWKLNTSKSHFQSTKRLSQVKEGVLIVSIATASDFKWSMSMTYMNGHQTTMGFDGAIDGKPYACKGAKRGTTLAFVDNSGVLEATGAYSDPGSGTSREIITISPDGNVMTSDNILSSPSGTTAWPEVWERVQDKRKK